jgi:hypothetical protein
MLKAVLHDLSPDLERDGVFLWLHGSVVIEVGK